MMDGVTRRGQKRGAIALVIMWGMGTEAVAADWCSDAVVVDGEAENTAELAAWLSAEGVRLQEGPACMPAEVRLLEAASGAWRVSLTLPSGEQEERVLQSAEQAATWVASWVRQDRLEDLLGPVGAHPGPLVLFSTWEDLAADRATGEADIDIMEEAFVGGPKRVSGVGSLVVADTSLREGRTHGRVFAFRRGADTFVNEGRPRLHRGASYGLLVERGDRGVYPYEVCAWVAPTTAMPGFLNCHVEIGLLDLETGETEVVTRQKLKRWLAEEPELAAGFQEERPKHAGIRAAYMLRLLEARPDAVLP